MRSSLAPNKGIIVTPSLRMLSRGPMLAPATERIADPVAALTLNPASGFAMTTSSGADSYLGMTFSFRGRALRRRVRWFDISSLHSRVLLQPVDDAGGRFCIGNLSHEKLLQLGMGRTRMHRFKSYTERLGQFDQLSGRG